MIHTGIIDVSDAEQERKRKIPMSEHTPFCRDLQDFVTKVLPFCHNWHPLLCLTCLLATMFLLLDGHAQLLEILTVPGQFRFQFGNLHIALDVVLQ